MFRALKITPVIIALFIATMASGQKNISSPYSRYGIGNLEQQGTFRTLAMGGISSGIRNNITLNYLTPASYSSIDTISFIFDFGIDYAITGLTDGNQKYYSSDLNFSHLMLGFPVIKGLGISAGLTPYSNGFYEIAETYDTEDPLTGITGGTYDYHKGFGGFQKFYLGAAYSPVKYFSAGINMVVLFGEINRINDYIFTSDNNNFNTRRINNFSLRSIGYEASAQLMLPMKEGRYINAGFTVTPGFTPRITEEEVVMRYSNVQTSLLAFDTLSYTNTDAKGRLPVTYRTGISFGKTDKLTVGADFVYSAWSKADLPGSYGVLTNVSEFHAGAEYVPDKYSNYSFLNRVEYRIGCRYGESYTLFDGVQLKEYGITFGAGIPLRRSRSRASFFVDLSNRGSIDGNLYKEKRISIGASLNLFDFWFIKAKYD